MSGGPHDDAYPFGRGFDAAPVQPKSFGDWAPIVLGHLQRIESSQAVIIRDVAVIQTRMESDREWRAETDARLSALEKKLHDAAIQDASRVGMVTGGWKVWTALVAFGGAVGGFVSWLLSLSPK